MNETNNVQEMTQLIQWSSVLSIKLPPLNNWISCQLNGAWPTRSWMSNSSCV